MTIGRAYQFDAMTIGSDGMVFCGESDRGGKLFLYIPGPGVFKGLLNPRTRGSKECEKALRG